jgi:antitoxin component YwqK of YwqJK toxin-antitoxin module
MHYFPGGKRKSIITYKSGAPVTEINYYPNGKIYSSVSYTDGVRSYQTCSDTSGNALTINGNGKWLIYNNDMTQITGGGQVIKGKPEGEWQETLGDSIKSTIVYHKGLIKSGVSYDRSGKAFQFKQVLVKPTAKLLNAIAADALSVHRKTHPEQPVDLAEPILTFWVDAKGKVSDIQDLNTSTPLFAEQIKKLVEQATWQPALHNGVPVAIRTVYPSPEDQEALNPLRETRSGIVMIPAGTPIPKVGSNINQIKGAVITY